jgi:hypothetical protein
VANIDLKDVIIFVGDDATGAIVEDMGMRYFYHPSVGSMPSSSAGFYGDSTFTSMMWLKVTAVYLGIHAGFDVLFQVSYYRDLAIAQQSWPIFDLINKYPIYRTPIWSGFGTLSPFCKAFTRMWYSWTTGPGAPDLLRSS